MERLNDDAQWMILLAFIISISIFFSALIINESVLVGQTTAESVLDLPKSDIQDMRAEVFRSIETNTTPSPPAWIDDIKYLSISRKNAIVYITDLNSNMTPSWNWPPLPRDMIQLGYNNGVVNYSEMFLYETETP